MKPTLVWTQEEEDIKCAKLLKCNKENIVRLSHKDRERLVNTTLQHLFHDRNIISGEFLFIMLHHHIPKFE